MEVEILRRVLPAAVENVGVNGYVSDYGIHQPNVTNLRKFFFTLRRFWGRFWRGHGQEFAVSVQTVKKTLNGKKIKKRFL